MSELPEREKGGRNSLHALMPVDRLFHGCRTESELSTVHMSLHPYNVGSDHSPSVAKQNVDLAQGFALLGESLDALESFQVKFPKINLDSSGRSFENFGQSVGGILGISNSQDQSFGSEGGNMVGNLQANTYQPVSNQSGNAVSHAEMRR